MVREYILTGSPPVLNEGYLQRINEEIKSGQAVPEYIGKIRDALEELRSGEPPN